MSSRNSGHPLNWPLCLITYRLYVSIRKKTWNKFRRKKNGIIIFRSSRTHFQFVYITQQESSRVVMSNQWESCLTTFDFWRIIKRSLSNSKHAHTNYFTRRIWFVTSEYLFLSWELNTSNYFLSALNSAVAPLSNHKLC